MMSEKRTSERFSSFKLISYTCYSDNGIDVFQQGMGRTLDVSEGGLLLETHTYVEPHRPVELHIGLGDDSLKIAGNVIYCRKADSGKYESGIEFIELDQHIMTELKKFIRSFHLDKKSNSLAV
ncbi:MAG: PilZ domain-containing protein [Desulfobacterales bacterium]|nr:PilZ domain-containing protein [Desulfobacterales bacterium]